MKKTALFPGSFDPFTAGHLDILQRALTLFDTVVVAIGVNPDKKGFFHNEKKKEIIAQATASLGERVKVVEYNGLTTSLCREMGIQHIVRGVRNTIDFEIERSLADANRHLAPEIETILIPTSQEFAHISSSAVRDILQHQADARDFLPNGVKL